MTDSAHGQEKQERISNTPKITEIGRESELLPGAQPHHDPYDIRPVHVEVVADEVTALPNLGRPSQQVRFDRRVVLRVHEDDVHRPVREVPGRLQRGPRDEAPADMAKYLGVK